MRVKKFKLLLLLPALVLLSACSLSTKSSAGVDSSVFLSTDSGKTWRSVVQVPSVNGQAASIAGLDVNVMRMDPQDNYAVYLASIDAGLYYTYKVTDGWNKVGTLPTTTIRDVKVDPKNKCIIYAALSNRLYRSSDCARTWTQVYFDNNAGVSVNTVAIDHYNTRNLYIGTSRGEIIKSIDSGESWRTIKRLNNGVARLIVSPQDSRLIFVASVNNNIFSFVSNTNTNPANSEDIDRNFLVDSWTDLNDVLKDFKLGAKFRDLIITDQDGIIYLATDRVILRSPDNGITWENIKLLQPEKDYTINAIAVNPKDPKDLYYVTNTTLFRSGDSGTTWTTNNLPTARAGRFLLIDFKNPNNIYLGTIKIKN